MAESFSRILVARSILSYSSALNQRHHRKSSSDSMNNTATGGLKSVDAPFEGGLPVQLKAEFFPLGKIRRTPESTIKANKFIPENLHVEVQFNLCVDEIKKKNEEIKKRMLFLATFLFSALPLLPLTLDRNRTI